MNLTIGSLFSGFLGLDRAVESAFNAETVWVSDIDKGACKVLAHRAPHCPNLGDITAVDWAQVQPVDIITGGSPCQDISGAGRRAGMVEGTRSNLWVEMREAIAVLEPAFVVWENVRGAYTTPAASAMESDPRLLGDHDAGKPVLRALGRVLGDLAALGFDAEWHGLRAADVGAPHGRFRVFVLASHPERSTRHEWRQPSPSEAQSGRALGATARRAGTPVDLLPTPMTSDTQGATPADLRRESIQLRAIAHLLPTPMTSDAGLGTSADLYNRNSLQMRSMHLLSLDTWGKYAAAIAQWEAIHGPAPVPTKPGRNGRPKLNPAFAEWMMGAPAGWITDTPGVTDNEALKMAGNGVVEQQAFAAIRNMIEATS